MMNPTKKKKLKKILEVLNTEEENDFFSLSKKIEVLGEDVNSFSLENKTTRKKLELDIANIDKRIKKIKNTDMSEITGLLEEMLKSFLDMRASVESGRKDYSLTIQQLIKQLSQGLTGVEKTIKGQPKPVWNFPQYLQTGVRNTQFSPINPATEEGQAIIGTNSSPSSTVGSGTTTIASLGVAVQVSATSVACRRVWVGAHESNTGTVVVGDSNVVAASVGRRGSPLYPTQGDYFNIANLNLLYVDSTANGDKINYYYEV